MNVRYTIDTYSEPSYSPDGWYRGEICTRPGVLAMGIEIENVPIDVAQKIRAFLDALASEIRAT